MLEKASKNSDRRKKFVELAERRTVNAIKAIKVLAKLGNKAAYEFDDADVKKIVSALSREIDGLKTRMTSAGGRDTVDFKL